MGIEIDSSGSFQCFCHIIVRVHRKFGKGCHKSHKSSETRYR